MKTYDAGDESVYFLYTSFLVALTKKAIISLRPVPAQANLWIMVNNNKTLLLVVFTFVVCLVHWLYTAASVCRIVRAIDIQKK